MRAFGLYLSEIVLGGARDRLPDRPGGRPEEPLAPLEATTLAAWGAWATRGRALATPPAPTVGDGLPHLLDPLTRRRRERPATG